jgi:hypothetical protein
MLTFSEAEPAPVESSPAEAPAPMPDPAAAPETVAQPVAEPITLLEPPALGVQPAVVLIGGVPVTLQLTPDSVLGMWSVKGPDFEVTFTPEKQPDGSYAGRTEGLTAAPGTYVKVTGDGYLGLSVITAYLIPRVVVPRRLPQVSPSAVALGTTTVSADGTFETDLFVPSNVSLGDYILQINGKSNADKVRSVNMALTVKGLTATRSLRVKRQAFFQARSNLLTVRGVNKLREIARAIPNQATDVSVTVTGVSIGMADLRSNLNLAGKRATVLVGYLRKRGMTGTFTVQVSTQASLGRRACQPYS